MTWLFFADLSNMYSLLKPIHGGLIVLISEVEGHIYKDNKFYCNLMTWSFFADTGPHSAVGNVSGYRCVSDCRSRGREFNPGPVPYYRGD